MKKIVFLILCISLTGCQATGEFLSETDRVLAEISEAVSEKDRITGIRTLNLSDRRLAHQRGIQAVGEIINQARAEGIKIFRNGEAPYERSLRIYRRVIAVSHYADTKNLRLEVIDDPNFNAITPGGGHIIIFKGLLDQANDDELAYVIGHELAHGAAGHLGESGAHLIVKTVIDGWAEEGYRPSFNNVQEQEADRVGILYSALAGFDPYASASVWQKRATNDPSEYSFFRTHPENRERATANYQIANIVNQYYTAGRQNPKAKDLLLCNDLFCNRDEETLEVGMGGGLLATFEVVTNFITKDEAAEAELSQQKGRIAVAQTTPNIEWAAGWDVYKGTIQRHGQVAGLNFGIADGRGEFYYIFNDTVEKGIMRYYGENQYGYWFDWHDDYGSGALVLEEYTDGSLRGEIFLDDGTDPGELLGEFTGYK